VSVFEGYFFGVLKYTERKSERERERQREREREGEENS
jgi:hypothetical protein